MFSFGQFPGITKLIANVSVEGSETSAISFVTPGNCPKENILHTGHGESLKSRRIHITCVYSYICMIH